MPKLGRSLLSFSGLIWTLTFMAVLFLCAFPLVRNLWAYYTWDRVPCWLAKDGKHFYFERNEISYLSECMTFWDALDMGVGRATGQARDHPNDSVCYVSRGTPMQAVYALDAHQHLDRALPRLGTSAMLVVVSLFLTRAARKRPVQPTGGAPL